MGASSLLMMLAMLSSLLGGGNELLDYLPTDAYWRAKAVQVTPAAMLDELKPAAADASVLIPQLGASAEAARNQASEQIRKLGLAALPALQKAVQSDDPEIAVRAKALVASIDATPSAARVRRLMAIRALSELQAAQATPLLKTLTQSHELFVAEYAQAALARIDGKPRVRVRSPGLTKDLWLLPSETRAVMQLSPRPGEVEPIEAQIKQMAIPPDENEPGFGDLLVENLLPLAEQIGNFRFDGLTVGASGDVNMTGTSGRAVILFRGKYDREAVMQMLALQKTANHVVDGARIYRLSQDSAAFLPSDQQVIVISSPQDKTLKIPEMVGAVHAGAGTLKNSPEMVKLIGSIDTTQPFWYAQQMTDNLRQQMPMLASLNSFTITASAAGPATTTLKIVAAGNDPAKLKTMVDQANQMAQAYAQQGKANIGKSGEAAWFFHAEKVMIETIASFKASVDGASVTATAQATLTPPDVLIPLYQWLILNGHPVPPSAIPGRAPTTAPAPDAR